MAIWNERIRNKRQEKGITLAQIADKLGVTEATAQRYESGNIKSIPYEHMCSYGEILGCSPAYLMGWVASSNSLPDYFDNTLDEIVTFLKKSGYTVLQTDSYNDDSIIVKNKNSQIIKAVSAGELVGQYEHLKVENLPMTIENILNIQPINVFPENIRAAARGMMDLSPEAQKSALDIIKHLSKIGKEAKDN